MVVTKKLKTKAKQPAPSFLDVYYSVAINLSNKEHAERVSREIHERCGFNMEVETHAR